MERTRLSNKGQVVIPHRIRKQFGWEAGLELAVEPIEGGIALRPVRGFAPTALDDVYGCLPYRGRRRSLADMERAIQRGAQEAR